MQIKRSKKKLSNKEKQFDDVFREFYKPLFLFARKIIPDSEIISDLLQDVFEKVWYKFEDLNSINNIQSYLFSSIRNECLNYIRRQKVKDEYYQYELKNKELELNHFSEDKSLYEDERLKKVNTIINNLPDKYKEVVVLSRLNNYSNKEISKELDIPVRTVETRLYRGLKKIKEEL